MVLFRLNYLSMQIAFSVQTAFVSSQRVCLYVLCSKVSLSLVQVELRIASAFSSSRVI